MTRSIVLRRCLGISAALAVAGCGQAPGKPHWSGVGDAGRGKVAIERLGCGSCHEIPGVMHGDGLVGPPLTGFARRTIVAGMLPNTPRNLVRWIKAPQSIVPGNAMPNAGLTEAQARDIAAYLYTLG